MNTCELCGTEYSILYDSHGIHDCVDALRAEVKRLEELIIDYSESNEGSGLRMLAEAKRIRGEK